jgi:hypothetical protein
MVLDSSFNVPKPDDYKDDDPRKSVLPSLKAKFGVAQEQHLFGISLFRNIPDATVKRGAIQKAVIVLLKKPCVVILKELLRELHKRLMSLGRPQEYAVMGQVALPVLKEFYQTVDSVFNPRGFTINLWGAEITVDNPELSLEEKVENTARESVVAWNWDPFPGASLSELVLKFQQDVMLLWQGVLQRKRILFIGENATLAGGFCLASPYLILPLEYKYQHVAPYVPLAYMGPIHQDYYVAGVTNPIFKNQAALYDIAANVITGEITVNNKCVRMSKRDLAFVKNLIGIVKDTSNEGWVRKQFQTHTEQFINYISEATTRDYSSSMFQRYEQQLEDQELGDAAMQTFSKIKSLQSNTETANDIELVRLFGELDSNLGTPWVREMVSSKRRIFEFLTGFALPDLSERWAGAGSEWPSQPAMGNQKIFPWNDIQTLLFIRRCR